MKTELIETYIYRNFYRPIIDYIIDEEENSSNENLDIIYNFFVAGGCFKDLLNDKAPKDFDIFCTSKNDSFYVVELLEKLGWEIVPIYISKQHENISNNQLRSNRFTNLKNKYFDYKIQVIHEFTYATVEECINSFDFTVCQAAVHLEKITIHSENVDIMEEPQFYNKCSLVTSTTFFEDVLTKRLRINNITFPVDSLRRAFRYSDYGYKPCKGVIKELADAIHNLSDERYNDIKFSQFYQFD